MQYTVDTSGERHTENCAKDRHHTRSDMQRIRVQFEPVPLPQLLGFAAILNGPRVLPSHVSCRDDWKIILISTSKRLCIILKDDATAGKKRGPTHARNLQLLLPLVNCALQPSLICWGNSSRVVNILSLSS